MAARRWVVLGGYAAAVYATLPYGPALGRLLLRTGGGAWLLGSGMGLVGLALGAVVALVLCRARAGTSAFVALALAAVGGAGGLAWLRAQHLERVHLPEYGVAAWLAWRALSVHVVSRAGAYLGAAAIAATLGLFDELLQAVTPGRVYDPRDVLANALGAVLGVLVLVAVHGGKAGSRSTPASNAGDVAVSAES